MATRGGIWQAKCCSPRRPSFPDRPITLSGLIGLPHSPLKFSRQETPNCVKPTQTQKQKLLYFEWSLPWHVGWWLSGEGCHLVEQHFIQNKNFHKIFGWGPARNTDLRRSWLRSAVEHWTHRVAVEVRRGTLSVHPCSWWRGRRGGEGRKEGRREGRKEGRKEGRTEGRTEGRKEGRRKEGEVFGIISHNPHQTGGEQGSWYHGPIVTQEGRGANLCCITVQKRWLTSRKDVLFKA